MSSSPNFVSKRTRDGTQFPWVLWGFVDFPFYEVCPTWNKTRETRKWSDNRKKYRDSRFTETGNESSWYRVSLRTSVSTEREAERNPENCSDNKKNRFNVKEMSLSQWSYTTWRDEQPLIDSRMPTVIGSVTRLFFQVTVIRNTKKKQEQEKKTKK